jgi:predicted O-linked N-acetylglucosamine transferase (SPINDLY family)
MFMAFNNLGNVLKEMRRFPDALRYLHQAIHLNPKHPSPHSNFIYALHYPHGMDVQTIFAEHIVWNARHARKLGREIPPHENDRSPDRRLRIGYVSADFRRHSVAYFLQNPFLHHDPASVEIFCYSDVTRPDEFTARLRAAAHHWRETAQWERDDLVRKIREDRIDILVDLAGHTGGSRLPVFACKPAPVQITYLGYPDTTGLTAMDYRLTDPIADPVGETERFHTEQLLRLPQTFLCYSPSPDAPEVSPLPAVANGYITFGSFNALAKITPPMIAVWSDLLQQTPGSRLIIKSHSGLTEPSCRRRLLEIFASCQISADRLELHSQTPTSQTHLELYGKIDIALDTYPYHGTATTCEALWMGVPVVSLAGSRHISRVGVSLLTSAGLPQFIATSTEAYVRIATQWARDPSGLSKLRSSLRPMMQNSPLLNGRQFAHDLESAYRRVWRQWAKTS